MGKCIICKLIGFLGGLGALNWLLVALFNFNLVTVVLGDMTLAAKIAYTLIGIAGAMLIFMLFKSCPCKGDGGTCSK